MPDDDARLDTAPDGPGDAPVVAFFDVDNTLLRGASVYHLGRGARRRGVLTLRDIIRFAWHQARFTAVGENGRHMIGARARALQLIEGHTEDVLESIADEVYDDFIAPRLWPETVELTREHLRKGHEVWLITATPVEVADVIAKRLGLTGAIGTRLESVDGVYTGQLEGPLMHGPHKAVAAEAQALEFGADLEACWAYSDSINDVPLLALVGNRVVVNPDARLAKHARANGWSSLELKPASIRAFRRKVRREAREVKRGG
ncbi:HAD family hydrolase [Marisediminicola sp. LYQ85]|uniref:HAD family hydrolase n=1 Tax=Marisediminicola sp. LYQ85 TaxID=3391062 RepID=UPI003983B9D3